MGRVQWEPVTTGRSGADVRRAADGSAYSKSGRGLVRDDVVAERERLEWLAEVDLPAARVLDWDDDGETATLTMSTVPGVALSDLPASATPTAIKSMAAFLKRLHGVPRESCPFERWLAVTVPLARVRVEESLCDPDDFDEERRGRSPEEVLGDLREGRPRAAELELGDLVVCHGDACLPN
ncbi:MAG: phosphotransferase, partial [Marmoricola sp.]